MTTLAVYNQDREIEGYINPHAVTAIVINRGISGIPSLAFYQTDGKSVTVDVPPSLTSQQALHVAHEDWHNALKGDPKRKSTILFEKYWNIENGRKQADETQTPS